MNSKQWFVLIIGLLIIQFIFIKMDSIDPNSCGIEGKPLSTSGVWCVVNAEMFDPFIWFIGFLVPILIICSFLEPKK